jgi:hypothetical protein
MKFAAKSLLLLIALATAFAYAQNNNIQQIQHVIVIAQENRTPTICLAATPLPKRANCRAPTWSRLGSAITFHRERFSYSP